VALLNREELYERLAKHTVQINFNKTNGEVRNLICTLNQDLFPANFNVDSWVVSEELKKPSESGRMNVWDLEANGWRSFLIENVNWVMTHDDPR
jgi:hypothetical protein